MIKNQATFLIFLLFSLFLINGCNSLFFYPMQQEVFNPSQLGLQYDEIYLKTSDNVQLHGWHLPSKEEKKGTIIFFHGNAENITTHIASIYWLPARNYEVYAFDYRGYGRSNGEPSIEGVITDALTVLDYVTNNLGRNNVAVFGQSLGCAVALNAVAKFGTKESIKAIAVDSCFSGFRAIAREKLSELWITWPLQYPLSFAFTASSNPKTAIASLETIPVLIIHGNNDEIIPIHHSISLYEAANNPKQFWEIEKGMHIDSMTRKDVRNQFDFFLTSAFDKNIPPDSINYFKINSPIELEKIDSN